jgi:hypothetical protein
VKKLAILVIAALAGCTSDMSSAGDAGEVVADTEPLTTCWNATVATDFPGFPPLDVRVAATAMKSWQGGSWHACTISSDWAKCICPRLVGVQQVVANWNYALEQQPGVAVMTVFYNPDASQQNSLHSMAVWTTDWDDDVFTHADLTPFDTYTSGTIDVMHATGNNWTVRTCLTK